MFKLGSVVSKQSDEFARLSGSLAFGQPDACELMTLIHLLPINKAAVDLIFFVVYNITYTGL